VAFLPTSRGLRHHQIGFLDSVFFVLPPLSLNSILSVNFNWQAACLCKNLLVMNSRTSRSRVLFPFNIYTGTDEKSLHFLLSRALRYHQIGFLSCDLLVLPLSSLNSFL